MAQAFARQTAYTCIHTYTYVPGVLYVCFSTGGDYNRWTYTNGYVNSPAWHMHYRVNQVRNVMVHATPRTLTNRFLPLYPRWAGSHTPHTVQAKKVPRYTSVRLARIDARPHASEDRETRSLTKKKKTQKIRAQKTEIPSVPKIQASTLHPFAVSSNITLCDRLIFMQHFHGVVILAGGGRKLRTLCFLVVTAWVVGDL